MEVIERQQALYPSLSKEYTHMGTLYRQKLYHELTMALLAFMAREECNQKDNFIQLYQELIAPIQSKLNPLQLSRLVTLIAEQYPDPLQAIAFLKGVLEKMTSWGQEAKYLTMFKMAAFHLSLGTMEGLTIVKKMLESEADSVEGLMGADPMVHASYYYAAALYYQRVGPAETFYQKALMFLAHSPYEDMKENDRVELATNLSLAALTGEGIFNFGEVLETPILTALEGTEKAWLADLLRVFNRGDIDGFNALVARHEAAYESQPALVNKRDYVKEKVALLALMELIFHRPTHERNIAFMDIAHATRLPLEQVEWLVMRAMSVKLIRGSIDQVEQIVHVTYAQPRVLDTTQIETLSSRLHEWGDRVKTLHTFMEDQTPELFE